MRKPILHGFLRFATTVQLPMNRGAVRIRLMPNGTIANDRFWDAILRMPENAVFGG
jgi:hypothetical protein